MSMRAYPHLPTDVCFHFDSAVDDDEVLVGDDTEADERGNETFEADLAIRALKLGGFLHERCVKVPVQSAVPDY